MDSNLTGLNVVITGASGGIGRALAQAFGREGCGLALHAHARLGALQEFATAQPWAERAVCLAADLRRVEEADALLQRARAGLGGDIDVCVVNAGIWPPGDHPLHELPPARIRDVLEVNLMGAIWTTRAFASALAQRGPRNDGRGASVCLIGSTAGRFGEAGHLAYSVSKSGLHGLMRSLKNELVLLDPYARVNTVEPGWTATPMARPALEDDAVVTRALQTMAVRQLARPEDIADAVVFLSAPGLARHISGEVLTVAGGMEGRRLWAPEQIDARGVRERLDQT